jgi:hypothetical protein
MTDTKNLQWDEWLNSRPPVIRELVCRFPPGISFKREGKTFYVVGYVEDGGLEISDINPAEDYGNAVATKIYFCPKCALELAEVLSKP